MRERFNKDGVTSRIYSKLFTLNTNLYGIQEFVFGHFQVNLYFPWVHLLNTDLDTHFPHFIKMWRSFNSSHFKHIKLDNFVSTHYNKFPFIISVGINPFMHKWQPKSIFCICINHCGACITNYRDFLTIKTYLFIHFVNDYTQIN